MTGLGYFLLGFICGWIVTSLIAMKLYMWDELRRAAARPDQHLSPDELDQLELPDGP
jgi:hypothetical protein